MSKRLFSSEQLDQLRNNQNVKRCSDRSITYAQAFKEHAVRQYEEGQTAIEIFKRAGFDLAMIGRKQPKYCLRRWRIQYKEKGVAGFCDTRGTHKAPKKIKPHDTETERLKWLESEVKYLRAENDFLAQLRAKKAERD